MCTYRYQMYYYRFRYYCCLILKRRKKKECLLNELHNPHSCLLNALFKSNNNDILHCIESYVTFLYFFTSKFEIVKEKKTSKNKLHFPFLESTFLFWKLPSAPAL